MKINRRRFVKTTIGAILAVDTGSFLNIFPWKKRTISASINVTNKRIELGTGWRMISEKNIDEDGINISEVSYDDSRWYKISKLPATVLAVLEENGVYKDLYYGKNFEKVPPLHDQNWWYRLEFKAPAGAEQYWLNLRGISYRADIYLNGKKIATNDKIVGHYNQFYLNITPYIKSGKSNALALKITPESSKKVELGVYWNDWINIGKEYGKVPDHNAGIWQRIYLETSGDVQIRHPLANTDLHLSPNKSVNISVYCYLANGSSRQIKGTLHGKISRKGKADIKFQQNVTLQANEKKEVSFTPESFQQLKDIANPDLWWPYTLGKPNLYQLELEFKIEGKTSDAKSINFGVRKVEKGYDKNGYQYLKINGKNFLVRGANYTPDLLFRVDENYERAVIDYVKDMGLNMIRWESKMGSEHMYEMCDREGIPIMLGWMCCGQWEDWKHWNSEDNRVAKECVRAQILDLRHRASVFQWAYASDGYPPKNILNEYKKIVTELHFQNPTVNSCSHFHGMDGIHMYGPYSFQPPYFWYSNNFKANNGYCVEQGDNEHVPPLESLKKYMPEDHLWPIDSFWEFHAGAIKGNAKLTNTLSAINNRFGPTNSVEDFCKREQVSMYASTRSYFESFAARGWEKCKGTLYWMLNNHWPSTFGHIFDYYLKPGGAYFGAKKGLKPLNIVYDFYATGNRDTANIYVYNQTLRDKNNLKATVKFYNIDSTEKYSKEITGINLKALSQQNIMRIPAMPGLSSTFFVRCILQDPSDKVVADNLYWQSIRHDMESTYAAFDAKFSRYADFTALNSLKKVTLDISDSVTAYYEKNKATIKLKNNTNVLAFFVRVEIIKGKNGNEVLPIYYNDNYITLFPSESKEIIALYNKSDLKGTPAYIRVTGYNLNEHIIKLESYGQ